MSYACARQILQHWRANPAKARQHDMRIRQRRLTRPADFRQDDMASKAFGSG